MAEAAEASVADLVAGVREGRIEAARLRTAIAEEINRMTREAAEWDLDPDRVSRARAADDYTRDIQERLAVHAAAPQPREQALNKKTFSRYVRAFEEAIGKLIGRERHRIDELERRIALVEAVQHVRVGDDLSPTSWLEG